MSRRSLASAVAAAACWAVVAAGAAGGGTASDDPLFDRQWNLAQIGAPDAWSTSTGAGVTIGIVDSGVDAGHPDLAGKVDAVADCVGGTCREGTARDRDGHGTAVAGIAAAHTGNGTGIAGVAPDARLVVAKALDDDGFGTTEDVNRAIQWVVDRGARVVNLSLGDSDLTLVSRLGTPLRSGIEYAWTRGAIPVLASGNYEDDVTERGSANYGDLDAVVVGATDRRDRVAPYSTSLGNAKWGVVAPGGDGSGAGSDVLATVRGGRYTWTVGTSMAAPHVSGVLALLLAQGLTPSEAVQRLLATAENGGCGEGCRGRVRAAAAVSGAAGAPSAAGVPAVSVPRDRAAGGLSTPLTVLAVAMAAGGWAGSAATWWWLKRVAG